MGLESRGAFFPVFGRRFKFAASLVAGISFEAISGKW